jgi:hypothetical protein
MMDDSVLADLLRDNGLITDEQARQLVTLARAQGQSLYRFIIESRAVAEDTAVVLLARHLSMRAASLRDFAPPRDLVSLVPSPVVRRHRVLPLGFEHGALLLAMVDPLDFAAIEAVGHHWDGEITPVLVGPFDLQLALDRLLGLQLPSPPPLPPPRAVTPTSPQAPASSGSLLAAGRPVTAAAAAQAPGTAATGQTRYASRGAPSGERDAAPTPGAPAASGPHSGALPGDAASVRASTAITAVAPIAIERGRARDPEAVNRTNRGLPVPAAAVPDTASLPSVPIVETELVQPAAASPPPALIVETELVQPAAAAASLLASFDTVERLSEDSASLPSVHDDADYTVDSAEIGLADELPPAPPMADPLSGTDGSAYFGGGRVMSGDVSALDFLAPRHEPAEQAGPGDTVQSSPDSSSLSGLIVLEGPDFDASAVPSLAAPRGEDAAGVIAAAGASELALAVTRALVARGLLTEAEVVHQLTRLQRG